MTDERLKELLAVSEHQESFDSAVVRELFVEADRLQAILHQLDSTNACLENKVSHWTDALERMPNELAEMEAKLRCELIEKEKRLVHELAEAKEQSRKASEILDPQNPDFKHGCELLTSCLEHIKRPETADYIKENLKTILM